jgi:hypothetical protein
VGRHRGEGSFENLAGGVRFEFICAAEIGFADHFGMRRDGPVLDFQ